MKKRPVKVKAPSRFQMALEARALVEVGLLFLAAPIMKQAPIGDGHPVMVLPGFGAGDWATILLRRFLRDRGYPVYGWGLGINLGYDEQLEDQLHERLQAIYEEHQEKVSLVGWSLGGVFAREMARMFPHMVRFVISIGSPFNHLPDGVNIRGLYEFISGNSIHDFDPEKILNLKEPPPVPSTSIYSNHDGVVASECCLQPETEQSENIEIPIGSHVGLVSNPFVYWVVANRLSQTEKTWQPFHRNPLHSMIYRQSGDALAAA